MECGKRAFHECLACVCFTTGGVLKIIVTFRAIGELLSTMTVGFALPLDLYRSLWAAKNG